MAAAEAGGSRSGKEEAGEGASDEEASDERASGGGVQIKAKRRAHHICGMLRTQGKQRRAKVFKSD